MVKVHSGLPIVELYINSFSESIPDIGKENNDDGNGDDEKGYSMIERDDPYWDEVNEPDLFVENNDVPGPSMGGGEFFCKHSIHHSFISVGLLIIWYTLINKIL
jgi:hypothetical protein